MVGGLEGWMGGWEDGVHVAARIVDELSGPALICHVTVSQQMQHQRQIWPCRRRRTQQATMFFAARTILPAIRRLPRACQRPSAPARRWLTTTYPRLRPTSVTAFPEPSNDVTHAQPVDLPDVQHDEKKISLGWLDGVWSRLLVDGRARVG